MGEGASQVDSPRASHQLNPALQAALDTSAKDQSADLCLVGDYSVEH